MGSLFGLAPSGVYPATTVAGSAVRSYRTISPLPEVGAGAEFVEAPLRPQPRAVYFLWHFPSAHAAQALPGTLPCGARTFLCPQAAVA